MPELNENSSRRAAEQVCQKALGRKSAEERIRWALETLPGTHVLSSSFGAQSAVMLHMLTRQMPDIPVIVIDTGYLFPETYRFIDELTERLSLNLKVYRPERSPSWQEAQDGRRWEQGVEGLAAYNRENKILPMEHALDELGVGTWFAGLRRQQSSGRARTPFIDSSGERWKVHPLWEKGYVSIGDVHTTRSLADVKNREELRFFGLTRECGLHEMDFGKTA
jgi:phosphoadenosine phosphosulfate reductase